MTPFTEDLYYKALSYEWDRSSEKKSIFVNGVKVAVKENLWQALYHLRHPTQPRQIWVDFLCINQEGLEEKATQLSLMTFIYERA
jgi:hypothetical protein